MAKLCFLHGLDSSPQGTKATFLKKYYPNCWMPALPPDIIERVEVLKRGFREPMLVVGTSLGGLTALLYAMQHPDRVRGLVLLAPAVGIKDKELFTLEEQKTMSSTYIPQGIPGIIVAGLRDDVIPINAHHELIDRSPDPKTISLWETDDDHDLHHSLDLMLKAIKKLENAE
jgi:alpha-beta hydrolase superfamily lysophospholipase